MKIYTKRGDKGNTSLLSGEKVKKSHLRVKAYGALDELNSYIGLLISKTQNAENLTETRDALSSIQSKLFCIGSHLACEKKSKVTLPKIEDTWVLELETSIDKMEGELDPLKNFIIPGGTELSALTHVVRTHSRNAERLAVEIDSSNEIVKYLNRLSDYFFVLARFFNKLENKRDVIWET